MVERAYVHEFREVEDLSDVAAYQRCIKAVTDPDSPHFGKAVSFVAGQGFGRAGEYDLVPPA